MKRREFSGRLVAAGLCLPAAARAAQLGESDAARGVRAALERGALAAVGLLGRSDGFLGNPRVRIPLPPALAQAERLLRAAGLGRQLDELTTTINRAAEAAVPQARQMLVDAVRTMTLSDAKKILTGGETSVTEFFRGRTEKPLFEKFLPIVTKTTSSVGLARRYNDLVGRLPVGGSATRIEDHVTAKALDGLYTVIGQEEIAIRRDPVGAGSDAIRKVFGALK